MSLIYRKYTPVFNKLATLYDRMVEQYDQTRGDIFTCEGCDDNCCTSYFQHHTYVEWMYFSKGMSLLPKAKYKEYMERATECVAQYREALENGQRPKGIMCPVNDNGLCGMYKHRLMICRMHGTANFILRPDGQRQTFSGCYRFVDATRDMDKVPHLDRTPLYRELAQLEMAMVGPKLRTLPKVDLTLAEMMVMGPPKLK